MITSVYDNFNYILWFKNQQMYLLICVVDHFIFYLYLFIFELSISLDSLSTKNNIRNICNWVVYWVYLRTALIIIIIYIFLFIDSEYSDEFKQENPRNRRESVVGLIPFPRVGRSDINNDLQMDNLCTYGIMYI